MYLAFPSENSTRFPHREGTLNFYDDKTHSWIPEYGRILRCMKAQGMEVVFARKQYQPLFYFFRGLLNEPKSRRTHKVLMGTWALWGFETVIWARKASGRTYEPKEKPIS